jgi:hypothetical protein
MPSPKLAGCVPDAGKKPRGKAKLLTLADLDLRTKAAQRALDMRDRIVAERGGPESMGTVRLAMADSLAVLSAMIESEATRWLSGQPVDTALLATLVNARGREAERVGLVPDPQVIDPDRLAAAQRAVEDRS